jgi:hypothetical protein
VIPSGLVIALSLGSITVAGQARAAGQTTPGRTPSAAAKKWTTPRTPWGHPDLQGTYTNNTVVPLERPAQYKDKAELTEAEVAARFKQYRDTLFATRAGDTGFYNDFWFEWGRDANRTSLIIDPPDGKLPFSPEGQAHSKEALRRFFARPSTYEDLNIFDRCITRSLPGAMLPGFYNHYYQILQTPDHVVLMVEMIHDVRIIPLKNEPHPGPGIRLWMGDSRGRWEGDTLVVETTNMNDKVKGNSMTYFGVGADLRLIERLTRIDENSIDYRFTVESPGSFTKPWTAVVPMWRTKDKIFEYACHEGNHAMPNSLSGARAEEAAELAKAKK